MRLVVTGATGNQGREVVRHALMDGHEVSALVRDPHSVGALNLKAQGVRIVVGDLGLVETMIRAFEGQDAVFSVQNFWKTGNIEEYKQARSLVQAARAAGVGAMVQTSMAIDPDSPSRNAVTKSLIEDLVRENFPTAFILRPVWFMEGFNPTSFDRVNRQFEFVTNPHQPHAWVSLGDIGKVVSRALTRWSDFSGLTLTFASAKSTGIEMAEVFSQTFGETIRYRQLTRQETDAKTYGWFSGQPEFLHEINAIFGFIRDTNFRVDWELLDRLVPDRTNLKQWAQEVAYAAWKEQLLPFGQP